MLATIKGVYNNGEITLEENPEVTEPVEVFVTFVKEIRLSGKMPLEFGHRKDMAEFTSTDFDESPNKVKDYMLY